MTRAAAPWIPAVLLLTALPVPAAGQIRPDSVAPDSAAAAPEPPGTGGWRAYAAVPHPWSTVVALTVVLPSASAEDEEDRSGTAWLLGRTTRNALLERLADGRVQVAVDVGRTRTVYQVLSTPDRWDASYEALAEVLFGRSPGLEGLETERASLLAVMDFESGAPVREFERETHRLLGGATSPWSRDPRGTPESLAAVTAGDLTAYRTRHYRREDAVLSVTGAVDASGVARLVAGEPDAGPLEGPIVAMATPPRAPEGPAWTDEERIHLVRDVTSGWIAAAYPVDPELPRTPVELVVHRARSELITTPPAPGLFSMEVELEALPDGRSAVVIRAAVLPDVVDRWEDRIVETMARVSGELLEEGFLRFHRRRFRNQRLVEDASPEAEGLRSALDLARDGSIRDLPAEIWGLDPESVRRAGTSLGPPRILVFGPDLAGESRTPQP